jgi:hypothetical protein
MHEETSSPSVEKISVTPDAQAKSFFIASISKKPFVTPDARS